MAVENQGQAVVDPYDAIVAAPASPAAPFPTATPSVASTSDSHDFSDYDKLVGASPTPKPSIGLDPYDAIVAGPNPLSYKAVKDLDTPEASAEPTPQGYGKREDGTDKGPGFLGPMQRPDGRVSTELSIAVNLDGKETLIPSLVPTLTPSEVQSLLTMKQGEHPSQQIVQKAAAFAQQRIARGQSPFFQAGEQTALKTPTKDTALENWLDSMGINDPKERALFNADKPQGERPPFALGLASWIDSVGSAVTGGRVGNAAEKLVQEGTYEPAPGEPSFTNAGIPMVPPQKGTGAQIAAGAANVPIGFANFLLSPGGIGTVEGLGLLPKVAQTLAGIGFTIQQAGDFFKAKTLQDKITTAVGTFLLGLGTSVHAKAKTASPVVEGEPNASEVISTTSVGEQPTGIESTGSEGSGRVESVQQGAQSAAEIDPYEAIIRREAAGERPQTETPGLPPEVEEPIISAGATAAGEPRAEGGENVAAVETPQDVKARLQYERELMSELHRTQRQAGDELVAAVIKAGGLPGKKSQYWSGELAALYENDRAKRIFRTGAKATERTATELTGFDFQSADDLIAALEDRFRTGRKHYPTPREIRDEAEIFGFGPGAAAKGELAAAGRKPIRMVNADIDAEREARGVEPLMTPARDSDPMQWDEAMARIDRTPQAPQMLADNINAGRVKSITDIEQLMLLHEEIRLRNEKAMEAERAVDPHSTEDERAAARQMFDALEARLDATERASRIGKRANAKALRIVQVAALDDYTLASLETRARNAKGTPLTLEESVKLKEQAVEIERLQGELAKFQDANAREKAMETLSNLMHETFKESKAQAKAGKTVIDILHAQRDAARQRIIAKRGRLNAGIDPTSLLDEAIIGASHIADGLKSLGDWSAAMVKDFGERIRPYLEDLFKQSKDYFDAHSKLAKPKATKPSAVEKIATAAKEKGEGGGLTNQMVFELAREHVRSGVTGLDEVMSAVQQDLEPHFPGLTVREVRDMFSDYGKVKFPSRKADLVALRDYRRQAQLVSALEDAQRRVRPERSGQQRDQPSAEVLKLQKQVKEEMQKAGFTAAPKPGQLRTDLDRFKASLATRTAEAERRIAEGDYEKVKRKPPLRDAEANRAAGKLALLKREIDIGVRRLRDQREAEATPTVKRIIRSVRDVPRAVAIGFHGTVGMVSHVGANIFRPSQWFFRSRDGVLTGYWPNFFRQFKLAVSRDYHERIVGQIVRNPDFLFQKSAGLAVDPAVTYTDYGMYSKILEKVLRLEAGKRGFDVLKFHRQEVFDRFWKTVPDSVKLDPAAAMDMARKRAMAINHGTGVISRSQSSFLSKMGSALDSVLFASRLEASRWARIIGDPVKTAETVLSGSKATPGERSVAMARVKAAVEFTAFYAATLVANNALQKMIGGRPINFTNPASPENDWLKHKVGGQTVMMDGGLLAPVRLIGLLVAKDMLGPRKELRGDTRTTAVVKDVGKYFLGKVNPAISIVKEQVTGEDFSGRSVPISIPKLFGAQPARATGSASKPVPVAEYLFSHGPIPASGATREIFDDLRNRGMSAPDAMSLLRGAAAFAVESTGVRVGGDYVPRPSHSAPVTPAGRSIIHQIKVRR